LERIIEKRVDDILASKIETKRRLSVSHTNLGIVFRYEEDLEAAKEQYEKAIELWPENHVAKDNLNRLLGLPAEKRSIIRELFYRERTKLQ
jgi:tetratricopeptide (TPR) repeat protein